MSDKISDKLNIVSLNDVKKEKKKMNIKNYKDDFSVAKESLKDTINISQDAINEMFEIARTSQSGRAFEVLATLLKTSVDASISLGELSLKEQKYKENEKKEDDSSETNPKFNLSEIISALKDKDNNA